METLLFIIFSLISYIGFSQQDTVVNKRHYNTVIYYPYFDYKCTDTIKNNHVIGIGNMIDSTKVGEWTYYLSDGKILAKGKYRGGYKFGKWVYLGNSVGLIWDRSAKAKDFIQYNSTSKRAEIIDVVNTKFTSYKMVNGCSPPTPHAIFRFL